MDWARVARELIGGDSFHGLIPYAALKLGLSLVNPTLCVPVPFLLLR